MLRRTELPILVSFATAIAACVASFSPLLACRYNVRDVGFVDQGRSTYQLELPGWDADALASLRKEFPAGNIQVATQQPVASHPDQTASLKSPGDKQLTLGAEPSTGWTASQLHDACVSKLSQSLVDRLIDCHSIVLLVEGANERANQLARKQIESAIEEVLATRSLWPKPIANPPEIVTIKSADRASELFLLESLGVDQRSDAPQAAILFGRGRRLGPVLANDDLQAGKLPRQLSVISIDCECDFNVAAMIGPMIPHAWSSKHEARASKSLQFDPGLPLVQVEVEQILSRWPRNPEAVSSEPSFGDPLLGYQEILLPTGDELTAEPPASEQAPSEVAQEDSPQPRAASEDSHSVGAPPAESDSALAWEPIAWTLGGLLLFSTLASGLLWLRRGL